MKKAFKLCGVTIFICIVLLFLKNQYAHVLLKSATYGMPALIEKGYVDNLYIGSSMFRQGLDIRTLNDNQEENYILAYNGNQPVLEYRQLKHLLDNGVKIQNLYVDMYVYSAWEEPEISDEKLFMEVDLKEKWELWQLIAEKENISWKDAWRIFVNSNNEVLLTWFIHSPIVNTQFMSGGTLLESAGNDYNILIKGAVHSIDVKMNPIQEEAIRGMITLCQEEGIELAFLETPKFEVITENEDYINAMKEYCDILKEENVSCYLSEETYNSVLPSDNIKSYTFDIRNAEYFMDTIHLSSEGRRQFSKELKAGK